MNHSEFESSPGLPERLPAGERLIWQGSPDWRLLALGAFRLREIGWYFGLLMIWHALSILLDGGTVTQAIVHASWTLPLAAIVLAIFCGMAVLSARTTIYSLTDERLVLRFGTALPLTINLPFSLIDSASVKMLGEGNGDISLAVSKRERVGYLMLWPHVRPWRFTRPEPTLRAISDVERVAVLLADALEDHAHREQATTPASADLTGWSQHAARNRDAPASVAAAMAS